jgi:hypothetical protein
VASVLLGDQAAADCHSGPDGGWPDSDSDALWRRLDLVERHRDGLAKTDDAQPKDRAELFYFRALRAA